MRSEYIVCDNCGGLVESVCVNLTLKSQSIYDVSDEDNPVKRPYDLLNNPDFVYLSEITECELCPRCSKAVIDALKKRRDELEELNKGIDYLDGKKYKEEKGE